jgi:hypothetical protein
MQVTLIKKVFFLGWGDGLSKFSNATIKYKKHNSFPEFKSSKEYYPFGYLHVQKHL